MTDLDLGDHLGIFRVESASDELGELGAMMDILVLQLRSNEQEKVTQFGTVYNVQGLEGCQRSALD